MKYLLDTDICIYYLKDIRGISKRIRSVGFESCGISEITVAELKYGIENSERKQENRKAVQEFLDYISIVPLISCFDIYAKEKARLKRNGELIDEFDLLIGCTAIANDMV